MQFLVQRLPPNSNGSWASAAAAIVPIIRVTTIVYGLRGIIKTACHRHPSKK